MSCSPNTFSPSFLYHPCWISRCGIGMFFRPRQPRVVASHNHAAGNCAFSFRRLSVAVYGSPVLNPLGMKAILVVIMTGGFLYASGSTKGRSPGFFVRFSHRARLLSRLLHSMQSRTQRYQGLLSFETFRPAVLFPSLPLLLVKVSFRVSLP